MIFVDNSRTRHIVKRGLHNINETFCGQLYNPSYGFEEPRAADKMPLCKTCKRLALAALKKMEQQ